MTVSVSDTRHLPVPVVGIELIPSVHTGHLIQVPVGIIFIGHLIAVTVNFCGLTV